MNLRILAWMKALSQDQSIQDLIVNQMVVRTPGLKSLIRHMETGPAGGCESHKFGIAGVSMGAGLNSTTLASTHYQISSNRMVYLQRSERDRYVFFQQLHHTYLQCLDCKTHVMKNLQLK